MPERAPEPPSAFTAFRDSRPDEASWYRVEPLSGFTPEVGKLVSMLDYTRLTTLQAVQGLSLQQLDALPPGFSNSVGMLLAHIAATHRIYQYLSFEGVDPIEQDVPKYRPYIGAMTFGQQGERVQGRSLDELTAELEASRTLTLAGLARQDDAWLASSMPNSFMNQHWAWFHVMEDEVSHRGQIRVLRKAIASASQELDSKAAG